MAAMASTRVTCLQLPQEEAENEVELEGLEVIDRWHPDPVDANPLRSQQSRRNSDTIGMLIGIYGSKDLFIKEYRCDCHAAMVLPGAVSFENIHQRCQLQHSPCIASASPVSGTGVSHTGGCHVLAVL